MKLKYLLAISWLIATASYAEIAEHHIHEDRTSITLNYEFLDFTGSKQKDDGIRYGVEVDYQAKKHHFQLYSEHTDTQTKPVIPKDLSVNKYAFKYQYQLFPSQTLSLSYIHVSDNLIKEVDGGNIYGLGYRYKAFSFTQYLSDYHHFDVYQSDFKWGIKKKFSHFILKGALIGKYMYLDNKDSNAFSSKAEDDYFTVGAKIHAMYEGWHLSLVGYTGERIFAVMNEGLRVQHHAMAFDKSMMLGLGKEWGNVFVKLRYIKQYATEVPIDNDDVKVENIALSLEYTF